jgi:hypothetical protein
MADINNFGLRGVSDNVQFAKDGSRLKATPSGVSFRDNADSAFIPVSIGTATSAQHAVTKAQLDSAMAGATSALLYKGVFDASAGNYNAIADASQGDYYKISVAGTIGSVVWNIGDSLIINKDVTGTPTASDVDQIDNTESSDIVRGRRVSVNFDSSSPVNIGDVVLSGANIVRTVILVDTAWDAGAPELSIGFAGSTSAVMGPSESDLGSAGVYVCDCNIKLAESKQMIATLANNGSPSAGAATVMFEFIP